VIYKIQQYNDKLVEKAYKDGMRDLGKFFGINWVRDTPNICILKNRKEIDLFRYKSKNWFIGFVVENIIYVLDYYNITKESSHKKFSKEEYEMLIKHELCHLFYNIISKNKIQPIWLTEGVSIYLSGQLKYKKNVKKFSMFIESYTKNNNGTYPESGKAVELLVINFGKKKLLEMISKSNDTNNKKEFDRVPGLVLEDWSEA